MKQGFLRVAAAVPQVRPADVEYNLKNILDTLDSLEKKGVEVAVFPEMSVTGYTCADLFHNRTLLDATAKAVEQLVEYSSHTQMHFIVGLPVESAGTLYNCGALFRNGRLDLVGKQYIPNYNEFYERRWWRPMAGKGSIEVRFGHVSATISAGKVFTSHGTLIGIEICEDLWVPLPPSGKLALKGGSVIFNLSASDDLIGKYAYLQSLISQQSARCLCGYVYAGAGWGESSTDLVFDGKAIIADNGKIIASNRRWTPADNIVISDIDIEALERDRLHTTTFADCAQAEGVGNAEEPIDFSERHTDPNYKLMRSVNPLPFVPDNPAEMEERCDEILNIQAAGLARRLDAINCKTLTVGISGGLDSTLALLVAVKTFDRLNLDRKGIVGVTMPGFGTTGRTHDNAVRLMNALGVTSREISIVNAVNQHFADIGHNPEVHDVTYENSQARERTQILMDVANQTGGIVLGTGDLSELALGWATYNGDHMSMYGVNVGVPKTLVRYLVGAFAKEHGEESEVATLLYDIIDTPISPELIPAAADGTIKQKTEDLVGPYELHDFFLFYTLRYGFSPERILYLALQAFDSEVYPEEVIRKWLATFERRFFGQQFKRSCLPDGPKVGSVCLSPRGDWRMPSDASSALWHKF